MGETFISCVFVCRKQGNGRRGKSNIKMSVGPWALVGCALMGRGLVGQALMGPPGPSWARPLWAGPLWAP